MKKFILVVFILELFIAPLVHASNLTGVKIEELVLPTEVKGIPKRSGSIYFSESVKNKVLIPTNFWGEIATSGLHFIPQGTSLIKGLSLAGGPTGDADISNVKVTRKLTKGVETLEFDLTKGGSKNAHSFALKPGDVVFIEKERFYQNRAWYTGLASVATTILTGIVLYKQLGN